VLGLLWGLEPDVLDPGLCALKRQDLCPTPMAPFWDNGRQVDLFASPHSRHVVQDLGERGDANEIKRKATPPG